MKVMRKLLVLPVLSLFLLLTGCSIFMTTSNYFGGVKKEKAYVDKHYKKVTSNNIAVANTDSLEPIAAFEKGENQKFRIGIVVSGDYWEYFENFKVLLEGLQSIGWANKIKIPSSFSTVQELMQWINTSKYSRYVEFPMEYYENLDWGDNMSSFENSYFSKKPNLDVVITYGTVASMSFYKKNTYPLPVLSDAVTDTFAAGITESVEESGKPFFLNKIDQESFKLQIRFFQQATGFKKLGIIYGENEVGRSYGAVNDVEAVAEELGFEIVRNTNVKEVVEEDTAELYLAALRDVASKVDAFYIGASTAVTEFDIYPEIARILAEKKIPSFAQEGALRVKDGILYSFSSNTLIRSGIFMATRLSHIFNSEPLYTLSQKFENISAIALNIETAKKIGYKIPIDILVNSEEIYSDWKGTLVSGDSTLDNEITSKAEYLPKKHKDGRKFRIAVVQSGEYWEYSENMKGILQGLQTDSWLSRNISLPQNTVTMDDIYNIICENSSEYIEFPRDLLFSFDWNNKAPAGLLEAIKNKEADLILSFGQVAGSYLSKLNDLGTPVLLNAITDPIGSGIISSINDSGNNFITCSVDPGQYQRQIELFYDLVGFKKLGLIYGDNEVGRNYSAVSDVEFMALNKGFEIVANTNVSEEIAPSTPGLYLQALEDLCSKVDAVYIGASTAVTEYDIVPQIAQILKKHKIPSFALEGDIRVKDGIFMGVSSVEREKEGLFNAEKIEAMLYGTIPRLLNQNFVGVQSIAINVQTLQDIGLDLPLATIAEADELF